MLLPSFNEFVDESRGRREANAATLLARRYTQCRGQMSLACAGIAEKQNRPCMVDVRRRERGFCGIVDRLFFQRRVDPGLRRQNGRLRRSANEAFGMSLLSFEKDLAPSGGVVYHFNP